MEVFETTILLDQRKHYENLDRFSALTARSLVHLLLTVKTWTVNLRICRQCEPTSTTTEIFQFPNIAPCKTVYRIVN